MPAALEHHAAFVNGVRLHYVRAGSGDPIFLLHGWPQTKHAWRKVIPLLAPRRTLVVPDLPGFGNSSPDQCTTLPASSVTSKKICGCGFA